MGSASPSNILGLMDQLHSLESSFISILMEAALKLGAITDTSVFLLIETNDGRRISGKRQLCDAYLQGFLTPTGNDVLFEVDPSVVALRQLPTHQPGHQTELGESQRIDTLHHSSQPSATKLLADLSRSSLPNNSVLNGALGSNDANASSRKRSSTNTAFSVPSKQPRQNCYPPFNLHTSQQSQTSTHSQQQLIDHVKIETNDDLKAETFPLLTTSEQDAKGVTQDNNQDENDVAVIEDGATTDPDSFCPTTLVSFAEDNFSDSHALTPMLGNEMSSDFTRMYVANVPFQLPPDFVKKVEALQSMKTPSVFEKNSIEHRLFTSCVYQLGSVLAKQACANPAQFQHPTQYEDFFNHHVNLWLSSFPYLSKCDSEGIRVDTGKGGMAIGGFVRHRARNSFRKGCVARASNAGFMASRSAAAIWEDGF